MNENQFDEMYESLSKIASNTDASLINHNLEEILKELKGIKHQISLLPQAE